MAVEVQYYTPDHFPRINEICNHPRDVLIFDPASIRAGVNLARVVPNEEAVGFFGMQGGDEGKGTWGYRRTHGQFLKGREGVGVRIGGSAGAGHSGVLVGMDESTTTRMLPWAVDNGWKQVVGRRVLVRPDIVWEEIIKMGQLGLSNSPDRIMVDGAAFLAWDAHVMRDKAEEEWRKKKMGGIVGTTQSGVGPAAADYTARTGLKMSDMLLNPKPFYEKIALEVERQNGILRGLGADTQFDPVAVFIQMRELANYLKPYIQNTYPIVVPALRNGNFMAEAAQAFRLGRDTGFPGSVTSTDTGPGPLVRGYRTSVNHMAHRIGVMKFVPTLVGTHVIQSPLPNEFEEDLYQRTEQRGDPETGRVSRRKRKYYWTQIPELRAAVETYDLTGIVIGKGDVADYLPWVGLGMEYDFPDGIRTSEYDPDDPRMLDTETRMTILKMPGWQTSTVGMRDFRDAPKELRAFVDTIEELVGVPVLAIGNGPGFDEYIPAENSPFTVYQG